MSKQTINAEMYKDYITTLKANVEALKADERKSAAQQRFRKQALLRLHRIIYAYLTQTAPIADDVKWLCETIEREPGAGKYPPIVIDSTSTIFELMEKYDRRDIYRKLMDAATAQGFVREGDHFVKGDKDE